MENQIRDLIKTYNLDVEEITKSALLPQFYTQFELSIDLGNNEGYYVNISERCDIYHLRVHDRDEAEKTLGVMLQLMPNN